MYPANSQESDNFDHDLDWNEMNLAQKPKTETKNRLGKIEQENLETEIEENNLNITKFAENEYKSQNIGNKSHSNLEKNNLKNEKITLENYQQNALKMSQKTENSSKLETKTESQVDKKSQKSLQIEESLNKEIFKNAENLNNLDLNYKNSTNKMEINQASKPQFNNLHLINSNFARPIISVIIPCFNEQENIADCYNELIKVWTKLPLYDLEVIFVDDGSSDWTVLEITKIQIIDPRVKLIEFSRNFGKEIAISAGFDHCSGESAIVVDADLQYPLDKIPEFVTLWESGSEVVIGMRDKKQTSNVIEKIGSRSFYWIMDKIGEREILPGALDFRLIDREVIDHFNRFTERNRMARALVDWLGFDRSFVSYQEKPRNKGSASYSLGKRIKLALNSFILHSLFPLKIAGYLGIFITIFAGFLGLSALVNQFFWNKGNFNFSGSFLLGLLNLFLIGIVLICLGLIALYIANIHTEVVNRPLYVVKTRRVKTQNRLQVIVDE